MAAQHAKPKRAAPQDTAANAAQGAGDKQHTIIVNPNPTLPQMEKAAPAYRAQAKTVVRDRTQDVLKHAK